MRPILLPCAALLATVVLATGCSSDEDDQEEPERSDLAERTAAAFEAEGLAGDRIATSCFALDDEGLGRVSEALQVDGAARDDPANLTGTPEKGDLVCSLEPTAGRSVPVSFRITTTDDDRDAFVARARDFTDPPERVDGTAPGLDADSVVGFDQGEYLQALWIEDGMLIAVGGPPDTVDLDDLFAALPVLVDEVDRVLAES